MRTRRSRQPKKPPPLPYELLVRGGDYDHVYERLAYLIEQHHDELAGAKIALAWATSWTLDPDGHQTLGKCKRATVLDRELHEWDFVILLNKPWWQHPSVTAIQRDALLDHELCHAGVKEDKHTGEPARDPRGRIVYRLRRHDLEEFTAIASRYGVWKRDLEQFAQALKRGTEQATLPLEERPTADAAPARTH